MGTGRSAAAHLRDAVAGSAGRLRALLNDPAAVQRRVLQRLLAANAASPFGRTHAFAEAGSEAEFRRCVPVRRYEELALWIERSAAAPDHRSELTTEPIVAFEETGGSSGGRRLVPYTASGLAEFQRGLRAWLDDLFTARPALADGRFYWSISPAGRPPRRLAGGLPVGLGSDAAYFGSELAPHVVASLAVPAEVGALASLDAWRRRTLAHLLACEALAMISVWSPGFLLELLAVAARTPAATLIDWLTGDGGCSAARASSVAAALAESPTDWARIWPHLAVISCWDQASAAAPAAQVRRLFPGVLVQGKGLLATEALVTLPLHDHPWPVLALESGYFEFADAAGRVCNAAEVDDGADYQLLLSNGSGFWRYAIGDVVRVRGFAGATPMLEFLGRAGGSDLCGEKLSDAFVTQLLQPHRLHFATLAADSAASRYLLVVDAAEAGVTSAATIAAAVERALHANPQYAHARALGQLAPVAASRCDEPATRWAQARLAAGQRLGDIKLPALTPADRTLAEWLAGAAPVPATLPPPAGRP